MVDIWTQLLGGFATAATPINLLWAFVGCALGTAIGVLPGLGPAVTVAMLLPITAQVEPTASMIFFAGIYYGAMYGGSTTSILLNTPGETGTMVTALEGFKMAKSGRAGAALATSAIGSFVAGTIATVLVTLFAPIVANYAVKLGPPEYAMLMLLAFTTVSAVLGKSRLRGLTALFIGLAAGCIGLDQITGQVRYTGGIPEFMDGIEVVLVAVGLFAVGECLYTALYEGRSKQQMNTMGSVHMTRADGAVPGPRGCGVRSSVFLSARSRRGFRDSHLPELRCRAKAQQAPRRIRDQRGYRRRGRPGIGQQRSDHRHTRAAVTLGIPTSVTAAILLSALQNYGINAGPQLFQTSFGFGLGAHREPLHRQRDCCWCSTCRWWVVGEAAEDSASAAVRRHPDIRDDRLYGMRQSAFDLFLMFGIGMLGVLMRRFDFPTAPVIVGMILGPLCEAQMRNALSIGEGNWAVFIQRPMSAALLATVVAVLVVPRLWARRRGRQ
jgi:putative tricarboxylic transport membrane protein